MVRIYYHNDMDGIASCEIIKWVCRDLIKKEGLKEYSVNYSAKDAEKFSEVNPGDYVYIVDYSFTDNTISTFRKVYYTVGHGRDDGLIWIDHHDSSIDFINKYADNMKDNCEFPDGYFYASKEGSGAYLCFYNRGVIPGCNEELAGMTARVPFWVRLISDYDTFTLEYEPETDWFKLAFDQKTDQHKAIADLLNIIPPEGWSEDYVKWDHSRTRDFMKDGATIKTYINAQNEIAIKACGYPSLLPDLNHPGEMIPVYVCNRMSNSWVFGELYDQYPYVVVWYFNGTEFKYSIFSNLKKFPDSNCQPYAENWGGGGHKGAAGWRAANMMFVKEAFVDKQP